MKRLNIILPDDVALALDGIPDKSRFIAQAIREKLKREGRKGLEVLLEEGYRASARESLSLTGEFEAADLEDWDEY